MKHRLDMRMRMYARIELHACGEINNKSQHEDLLLLRARIAALLEQERFKRETTTLPLFPTTNSEVSDGDEETQTDIPPWEADAVERQGVDDGPGRSDK